jgi:hypothetical protein
MRRRRGLVLVVALAVVVAGLVGAAAAWATRYAPLGFTGGGVAPTPGLSFVDAAAGSGGRPVMFVPRGRRLVFLGFTLSNTGRVGVDVRGVDTSGFDGWLGFRPVALRAAARRTAGEGEVPLRSAVAARSLHIPAGGARFVWVALRVPSCANYTRDVTVSVSSVPLRFRYLGLLERTQAVELPAGITLRC